MKTLWLGALAGALGVLGVATTTAEAAPLGHMRPATVAGAQDGNVVQVHGRRWRHHHRHRHYRHRHYRPRYGYYYGSPYYYRRWDWIPPRRYYYGYGPSYYYGSYGYRHRRPGFAIWF